MTSILTPLERNVLRTINGKPVKRGTIQNIDPLIRATAENLIRERFATKGSSIELTESGRREVCSE